jgi:hypothetical protein
LSNATAQTQKLAIQPVASGTCFISEQKYLTAKLLIQTLHQLNDGLGFISNLAPGLSIPSARFGHRPHDVMFMYIQPYIGGIVPCCRTMENTRQSTNCFDTGLFWDKLLHDLPSQLWLCVNRLALST